MYRKGNNYSFLMWQADLTKVSDVHYTYQSSPSTEQGENMAKGLRITIRTGTLLKNYHHYHNGEITLIHCHLTVEQDNESKSQNTFSHPSLIPRRNFPPKFSTFSPQTVVGDNVWVLQSVHRILPNLSSHSLSLFKHGVPSSINFAGVDPSCGIQFFTKSLVPSYGVWSFRNRLLHHRSPMGSQILTENLFQCGLLFTASTLYSPELSKMCLDHQ